MAVLEFRPPETAVAPPGPELAAELGARDLALLSDAELVDFLAASRRLASWVQAGELAAAAELARRRPVYPYEREFGDGAFTTPEGAPITEFVVDEVRGALTLTGNAAVELIELGLTLEERLPATRQALRQGEIDLPKTKVIARATSATDEQVARRVEQRVLPAAPRQTTGELRASATRAVLAADPAAADRCRKQSEAARGVSLRHDEHGTASLSGWRLPADQAIAAANRLNAIARAFKTDGDERRLDNIRADVFLSLLLGLLPTHPRATTNRTPPDPAPANDLHPTVPADEALDLDEMNTLRSAVDPAPEADSSPATAAGAVGLGGVDGLRPAGGSPARGVGVGVSGGGVRPWYDEVEDDLGGREAAPAREAELAARAGARVGTVHLTLPLLTYLGLASHPGHVAGYGPLLADVARILAESATARDTQWCVTVVDADGAPIAHGETRYRPSPRMQDLVECRDQTCRFPGCRMAAYRCDLDHTIPHDQDGPTCPCNLSALCRRHHRLKQREGWELHQISPGVLVWMTPTGHWYLVRPDPYPTE